MIEFVIWIVATCVAWAILLSLIYSPGPKVPIMLPITFLKYLVMDDFISDYSFPLFPSYFAKNSLQRKAQVGYRECRVRDQHETMLLLTYGELRVARSRARWTSYYASFSVANPVPDRLLEAMSELRT